MTLISRPRRLAVARCDPPPLGLHLPALGVVPLPDDYGIHAVDNLGQVGDGCLHAAGNALAIVDGRPLEHGMRPRLEGEPFVVYPGRIVEVVAVEVLRADGAQALR